MRDWINSAMLVGTFVLLAACKPSATPGAEPRPAPAATGSANAAAQMQSQPATTAASPNASEGDQKMEKRCGGAEMRIVTKNALGTSGTTEAPETSLQVVVGGNARPVEPPGEMKGYSPVGLACAVAKSDNQPYFVVQFGELPAGCSFCEWFYLYDGNGKQLTSNVPPIKEDLSMPEGQRQSPNNDQYVAELKKLGLDHPEIDTIE